MDNADGNGCVLTGRRAARSLLAAEECVVALIDYQGIMLLGVESYPLQRMYPITAGCGNRRYA